MSIMQRAYGDLERAERAVADAIKERDLCLAVVERLKAYEATEKQTEATEARAEQNPGRLTLAQVLENILLAADHPLLIDDLIHHLNRMGRLPGGQNPKANVASVLSKAPQFTYRKNEGWQLRQSTPPSGGVL